MGNSLGMRRFTKVMKIDGETFKLRTPVRAAAVLKDYPGHVLLESEAVKHFGVRAKPMEPHQDLKPKRLYFLVTLPKLPEEVKVPRRARSGINMSAKDRLEGLMLARRSVSDLSIMKPKSLVLEESNEEEAENGGVRRVRMTLPKAEVVKMLRESKDDGEAAERIVELYVSGRGGDGGGNRVAPPPSKENEGTMRAQKPHWRRRERRVGFHPIREADIQVAVA